MDQLLAPAPVTVLTGASGWFGRSFLAAVADPQPRHGPLRPGRVRVLVGRADEVPSVLQLLPDAEVYVGDVADPVVAARLMRGAEGGEVVHAAGVIHPDRAGEFDRVNVGGTRTMLAAAAAAGVRRFVHVSSNSAFGVNPTRADRFRQEEPFRPYLGYGASKARAERLVRDAHAAGGMETVVIRPPWFYGSWQPERQTTFFTMVARGRFPLMGDGGQIRSMVHVDNLVQGAALAGRVPGAAGGAFWIADRTPYPMREVVATVAEVLGEEGYVVAEPRLPGAVLGGQRVPATIARTAEQVDRFLQGHGRYQQSVHVLGEMDKTIACDIAGSERHLGYRPAISLREGMRMAVRWCRDQGIAIAPRRTR